MNKLLQTISLCKRAGKLILGFDVVKQSLIDKTAVLLIVANDISPKTLKEVEFLSSKYSIPIVNSNATLDELWFILNKRVGVMSLIDEQLAKVVTANARIANHKEENI